MTSRLVFGAKNASETLRLTASFANDLAVGETVSSASVSSAVYSGIAGTSLNLSAASLSSPDASTNASDGTEGVTYLIVFLAVTSLGQTLTKTGYLVITPEGA